MAWWRCEEARAPFIVGKGRFGGGYFGGGERWPAMAARLLRRLRWHYLLRDEALSDGMRRAAITCGERRWDGTGRGAVLSLQARRPRVASGSGAARPAACCDGGAAMAWHLEAVGSGGVRGTASARGGRREEGEGRKGKRKREKGKKEKGEKKKGKKEKRKGKEKILEKFRKRLRRKRGKIFGTLPDFSDARANQRVPNESPRRRKSRDE